MNSEVKQRLRARDSEYWLVLKSFLGHWLQLKGKRRVHGLHCVLLTLLDHAVAIGCMWKTLWCLQKSVNRGR